MKNWRKLLALLSVLLLVVAFAACTPVEEEPSEPPVEQTETPTEAPTEAPTETPTEAPTEAPTEPADYTAYKGNWYSGSVTLEIQEENQWVMLDNGEIFITGHLVVTEEDKLTLYDVEGTEAANLQIDADGTLYAELYVEEMYNRITDFIFTRTKSEGDVTIDVGDPVIEEIISEEIEEEAPPVSDEG